MIVRNEANVVVKTLESVAPHIDSWVIVDTGSSDGTQALIQNHMARLGVPGILHERPWRNFGENRTEAINLAQGRADYIWVFDADDILFGTPDFTHLGADAYRLHYRFGDDTIFWRPQLFRDGLRWRYEGLVHENPVGDPGYVFEHLKGDYHIEARSRGARSQDPHRFARDRELLLNEVKRDPGDRRAMLHLAQTYFGLGDFVNARRWFQQLAEMGDSSEGAYLAMFMLAESMMQLDAAWPDIQDVYLKAWDLRPTRAEPLYAVARRHRIDGRYQLGYLFAERAARIPLPETDAFIQRAAIYEWCATDELSVCASQIGNHIEAFSLCRRLLARADIPDHERQRIAVNRDFSVPAMIEAALCHAGTQLATAAGDLAGPEVLVSVTAGPDRTATERTLDTFLHCCTDVYRARRFLILDVGLSTSDRAILRERYGLLAFAGGDCDIQPASTVAQFWLHLGQNWQFFAPDNFITRLTAVLNAEPQVFQVGINFADAVKPIGAVAAEETVRRAPNAGRYVLTDAVANGPAMFNIGMLNRAAGLHPDGTVHLADLARLATAAGLKTATLDEVFCVAAI